MNAQTITKRALSLLLSMTLVLSIFSGISLHLPMKASAVTEEDFSYRFLDDGTCSLTGYTGTTRNLVIPSKIDGYPVTSIGRFAFEGCSSLISVTIPEGVTYIDDWAFSYCNSLTSVDIPESVTRIGTGAFEDCSSLTSVTIPEGVISIGASLFAGCSSLTSVIIPEGVVTIGDRAFWYCSSLASITIPESVISIGDAAFSNCSSFTSVIIPKGVTSIGDKAFYGCSSLTSVAIPEGVVSIGNGVFEHCSNLTSVIIPEGVTSIGERAFWKCSSLTSVTIPESVTSIGLDAFYNCSNLWHVLYTGAEEQWNGIGIGDNNDDLKDAARHYGAAGDEVSTCIISEATCMLSLATVSDCIICQQTHYTSSNQTRDHQFVSGICCVCGTEDIWEYSLYDDGCCIIGYSGSDSNVVIPETIEGVPVIAIGVYAFQGCSSLTSVTIPESVTSIGEDAFFGCSSLTSVTIPEGVIHIGSYAFEGCTNLTGVIIPESVTTIGYWAFSGCTSLTAITIPGGITNIEHGAFYDCGSLTSVTISEGVTSIEEDAFSACTSLISVTIPESVTSIGLGAFSGCSSLWHVLYTGTEEEWDAIDVGEYNEDLIQAVRHYGATGDEVKTTIVPEATCQLGTVTVSYCSVCQQRYYTSDGQSRDHQFVNGICRVCRTEDVWGYSMDNDGCHITGYSGTDSDVIIPETIEGVPVIALSYFLFNNCNSLTSVTIPKGVTSIGDFAFSGCSGLTNVIIPDSVTDIGGFAFSGCSSLSAITFCGTTPTFGDYCFMAATVTAYYPANDPSWTQDVMQDYGGSITWVPYGETDPVEGITVSGTLTSFQGENLVVELWQEGAQEASYSAVITDGSYCFENVPEGDYILKVSMDHGVTREYQVTTGSEEIALDVKISPIGDLSGDGKVNVADSSQAYAYAREAVEITDEYALLCGDVTGDGRINVADVSKIYAHTRGVSSLW